MASAAKPLVLVTGGAGFIGSHVCDALLARGDRVRCLDDLSTGNRANIARHAAHPGFSFVQGDIRSTEVCRGAVNGVDAIVHLAALGSVPRSIADPLTSYAVNLGGFLHLLEAARAVGVGRFIYASSSSVYGDSAELPKREDRIGHPLSPYAATKLGNEHYARLYAHLHGMRTIGLRFFNVFGERQDPAGPYAAAIPRFIAALCAHQRPVVHGDGLQSRDFTYVGNAVQAVLQALDNDDPANAGEVFNVAFGVRTTVLDLLTMLREEIGATDPSVAAIEPVHTAGRPGDVRDSLADITKARERLGYHPTTGLREGLRRTLARHAAAPLTAGPETPS